MIWEDEIRFANVLRAVDKFRISALHSSRLTAAYESTPHSPLVARLDLHNFSSALTKRSSTGV
jgi:hypothetical protein